MNYTILMEHESRPDVIETISITNFFRHFNEYDVQACAYLAIETGVAFIATYSAIEDFAQGNIGTGVIKSILDLVYPIGGSFLTARMMLENVLVETVLS